MPRKYRILIGDNPEMLAALATKNQADPWTLDTDTIRKFSSLSLDYNPAYAGAGNVNVAKSGCVGLAFKDE